MNVAKHILLAVLLLSLTGIKAQTRLYNFNTLVLTNDSVRLNFTILQASVSCAGYQILKGSDSLNLVPIFVYPGICGTTSSNEIYNYYDVSPNKLSPNFYQVYIPPNDYSPVRRVDIATAFTNLLVFPQPVEDILNIAISDQKNYYYEINIYDRFGKKKGFGSGNVTDKISLDVSGFSEGVYVFYIVTGNGGAFRGKFLKKPRK